jgi:hypothetical protein
MGSELVFLLNSQETPRAMAGVMATRTHQNNEERFRPLSAAS